MKHHIAFAILIICLAAGSCHNRRGAARAAQDQLKTENLPSVDTIPDWIYVTRHWRDLKDSAYLFEVPEQQVIAGWKREFEELTPPDSVWRTELEYYSNEDRWMTVNDFIELFYQSARREDNMILWRLLQYAPGIDSLAAESGFDRVLFIRHTYESLLDYEKACQWDMTYWAWLLIDFDSFYIRTLYNDIRRHCDRRLASAIKKEETMARIHHDRTWDAFQKIIGTQGFNGTSFPYRCGVFGDVEYRMEIEAQESFLHALYDDSFSYGSTGKSVSENDIIEEYSYFSQNLDEDELSYPIAERRALLDKDKKSFINWMDARKTVSSLLTGRMKELYGNATNRILRQKLILLKNRYNCNDGFCPDYTILLDMDCSDEELFSFTFENS